MIRTRSAQINAFVLSMSGHSLLHLGAVCNGRRYTNNIDFNTGPRWHRLAAARSRGVLDFTGNDVGNAIFSHSLTSLLLFPTGMRELHSSMPVTLSTACAYSSNLAMAYSG
jgi:hypothetical protein